MQEELEVFDQNHDGVLCPGEIEEGTRAILKYDLNKDGRLDEAELGIIRRALRTGVFGRSEWDMKVPGISEQQQVAALRSVMFGLATATVLSQMARVDMSVGIIPICAEMGWGKSTAGMVQSAFFQGFVLSQLPSGLVVNSLNARHLLLGGVLLWSLATVAAPLALAASGEWALPALCATRFVVGIGQGCVDASVVDTISRWSPSEERSRSSGQAFSGYNSGMVAGLLLGPALVTRLGWPWLFYVFGGLGFVWAAFWAVKVLPLPQPEKSVASMLAMATPPSHCVLPLPRPGKGKGTVSKGAVTVPAGEGQQQGQALAQLQQQQAQQEQQAQQQPAQQEQQAQQQPAQQEQQQQQAQQQQAQQQQAKAQEAKEPQRRPAASALAHIPLRAMLSNRSVQGLCISHFIYGWGIFSLGAWLPTYINEALGMCLSHSALLALLPPLGGVAVGILAAIAVDTLRARHGWSLTAARRAAQVGCFLLPSACFLAAVTLSSGWLSLSLIMAGQAFHGLAMVGIWCSHADIAPRYGGLLASITSSFSSVAGALSVSAVGKLHAATGSWNIALVGPLVGLYLIGAAAWAGMVVNEPQDFGEDEGDARSAMALAPT
ncbi:hypothetical protein FOA52_001041 [Chlamydomonas sp. UWO 241]|nr:hypothetical protein FOA52_001041 [Chlamydomonas sp. UWO 241]